MKIIITKTKGTTLFANLVNEAEGFACRLVWDTERYKAACVVHDSIVGRIEGEDGFSVLGMDAAAMIRGKVKDLGLKTMDQLKGLVIESYEENVPHQD